jgi:predicted transposase YdaD
MLGFEYNREDEIEARERVSREEGMEAGMVKLRLKDGRTLVQIAEEFGISERKVKEIATNLGFERSGLDVSEQKPNASVNI